MLNPQKVLKQLYMGSATGYFQPLYLSQFPWEHYRGAVLANDESL